jgi:integrase
MRGSLVNRNGHYSVILEDKDEITGKRKQRWIAVGDDCREAEKIMTRMVNDFNNGNFVRPGKVLCSEFFDRWLKEYAKINLAENTYECYDDIIRLHLSPSLGKVKLTSLKPENLQKYYADKLNSGLSNRTVRYHHTVLHNILKTAMKWGLLQRNVCDLTDPPSPVRVEMHTMNEDEIRRFLEAAKSTKYYPLFFTALYTALRRSELLALKWVDVDLLSMQVSVNKSLHQLRNGEIIVKQPKTQKSRRLVSLTPANVIVLREHRESQNKYRESIGSPVLTDNDFVFCNYNGKHLLPDSISHIWMKMVRRLGLKNIRLHDARHTHASLMLKQGVHPKIVQERLGHASIQITLDTYSHVAPGLQQAAANKFDDIMINHQRTLALNKSY